MEDITTLSIMSILDTCRVNDFSVIYWLTNSQRDKHHTESAVLVSNVAISSPRHDGVTLSGVFVSARASRVLSKITKSDTPSAKHGIKSLLTNPSLRHFKSEQNANKSQFSRVDESLTLFDDHSSVAKGTLEQTRFTV